ncbi:MAG: MgtC/SapB family protein [Pedobacter sp.]|nr:MAG: MgtC/SapB family protein [Pedobacter sp.]
MEDVNLYYQLSDIWKAVFALFAGIILGYERESKDKSAGLKTITIITLGSTLLCIISQNYSVVGDSYTIAAGVITGIGFLGAGVIYKAGFNIYGLTTAGIIWASAAIGLAIGFGEFKLTGIFLGSTLVIIYGTQLFQKLLIPANIIKSLHIELKVAGIPHRLQLIEKLKAYTKYQSLTKTKLLENGHLLLEFDIYMPRINQHDLENFLLAHPEVASFEV